MTITLSLTPEQEIQLRRSKTRNDRESVRRTLHQALDESIEAICAQGVEDGDLNLDRTQTVDRESLAHLDLDDPGDFLRAVEVLNEIFVSTAPNGERIVLSDDALSRESVSGLDDDR